ncbi:MAG: Tetratricopeptide TPR_1 repeat-containing protein [candidate division TM6 bacterium GW2011_GWF2_37_49]|nr:MAG: Tetratricopeptide TPR_1 repeat-containing protein [candidate division TM6 bacterium GW2011_GWF2_37_49]
MIKGKRNSVQNLAHTNQSKLLNNLNKFSYLIPPGILVILTSFFYYFSLNYPFQFDDIANITKKFAIRFDDPLSRWWVNSRWFGDWLNRLNFEIGRFDSFWYRLCNVMIHVFAGLAIFYLIKALCEQLKEKSFFYNNSTIISFVCAGLFLLHPVQSQTVSYVIQARIEGVASLLVLFILLLFVKIFTAASKNLFMQSVLGFILFISALFACGTKEIVIVTPFLMALIDWFFLSNQQWDNFKSRLWFHAIFDIYFLSLMAHYLSPGFATKALTLNVVTGNNRGNVLTDCAFDTITPLQYLMSEFRVVWHYLWMFVWPLNISVEYDWRVAASFWQADVLLPLIGLLTIVGTAIYSFFHKINSYFVFGIFWFFICVAPRSSIIPSPELVCDYKTYLASVGWLFVLSVFLVKFAEWLFQNVQQLSRYAFFWQAKVAAFSALFILVGFSTYNRNQIWSSSIAFWEDNVKNAPGKARVFNNYGVALSEAGRVDESIIAYQRAIDLDKYYSDPLSNIAVAYSLKDETDKAIDALKSALVLCQNYPEALNNLGTLYIKKKEYKIAEDYLLKAIELRPYYGKAYYNMGRLYLEKNQNDVALGYFKKAVEGDLDTPEGFYTYAQICLRLKKFEEAAQALNTIIKRGGGNEIVWFNLANSYFMLKDYDKAQKIYQDLVAKNPMDGRYLHNLGETLYSKKDYSTALEVFKKGTSIAKPVSQTFFRIVSCLEMMNKYDEAMNFLKQLEQVNTSDAFKKNIRTEMARLAIQEKIDKNGNKVKVSELKQALALGKPQAQNNA